MIMIIFLNNFLLRLNYDYGSISFSDYNYNFDYEKIDYNRNWVIMIIIYPNPDVFIRYHKESLEYSAMSL
jgi:hypothetical protein